MGAARDPRLPCTRPLAALPDVLVLRVPAVQAQALTGVMGSVLGSASFSFRSVCRPHSRGDCGGLHTDPQPQAGPHNSRVGRELQTDPEWAQGPGHAVQGIFWHPPSSAPHLSLGGEDFVSLDPQSVPGYGPSLALCVSCRLPEQGCHSVGTVGICGLR